MVHQHFRLVEPFTVAENVVLGDHRDIGRGFRFHPRAVERAVAELGHRYGLAVDPRARIWQLSVGEQQRVEILKALYREARILILDEPTAVLTPQEADGAVRDDARDGRRRPNGDLHLAQAARGDRGRRPRHRAARRPLGATLPTRGATRRSLAALMVGREIRPRTASGARARRASCSSSRAVARTAIAASPRHDVELRCGRARSSAIAGVAGNGQRELAEAIAGMRRATPGASASVASSSAAATRARRSAAGVAHVPEDRLHTGVAPGLQIASNVVLKSYRAAASRTARSCVSARSATARSS